MVCASIKGGHENEATLKKKQEKECENALKLARSTMQFLGIWPVPTTAPITLKIWYGIKNAIVYLLLLFNILPGLLRIILLTRTVEGYMRIGGPVFNCILQLLKYTVLLRRHADIRKCLDLIRKDWIESKESDREIFKVKAVLARRVSLIHLCTMYCGGLGYRTVVVLSKGPIVTADNVTIRPMPTPAYFVFFDEQATPFYEIVLATQFLSGFVAFIVMSCCCSVCSFLILHACSQLEILVDRMRDISKKEDLDEITVQRWIVDVVERRTKIKMYLGNTETITEYICLIESLGGTFLVCCVGYYITCELQANNIGNTIICCVLLYAVIFSIFIFCYIGQLLYDENNNVGLMSTTFSWYQFPKTKARNLILVIAISNYPLKLTAGKVMDMSFATFTDIMKVAMGYFNLMLKFM